MSIESSIPVLLTGGLEIENREKSSKDKEEASRWDEGWRGAPGELPDMAQEELGRVPQRSWLLDGDSGGCSGSPSWGHYRPHPVRRAALLFSVKI